MSDGFEEDQARFTGALALSAYLASWDYRCAFFGEPLGDLVESDPTSALLLLVPQSELRANLILPACIDAQRAYLEGALRVGPDLNLIVNPSVTTVPGLLERLNPDFRLRLPGDVDYAPNLLVLRDQCRDLLEPR